MKVLVALLIVLTTYSATYAENCRPKMCTATKRDSYIFSCGFFGWARCTRYRIGYQLVECGQICDPVDCKWGPWADTGSCDKCSSECGGGEQTCTMTRRIIQKAAHGGKECTGSDTKTEKRACNQHHCPVDCTWSEWSDPDWSDCSKSCGAGKQHRILSRTQQPPASHGGKECTGSSKKREVTDCNTQPCPIDGGWTDWSEFTEWTDCSTNCDQSRSQNRTCTSPPPAHGGKDCDGNNTNSETRNCYQGSCLDQACLSQNANRAELPRNCNQFVVCQDENHVVQNCPTGTHWNQTQLTCVHEASSGCEDTDDEEPTTTVKPELEICIWPKYTRSGVNCAPCTENFVDTEECTNYYFWCVGGLAYKMKCPAGTHYNRETSSCDNGNCS